jgi:hypothetical protein
VERLLRSDKIYFVAGDVFDGDWFDVSTCLFFARQLDTRRPQRRLIENLRVALHGLSFLDREATVDFLSSYPPRGGRVGARRPQSPPQAAFVAPSAA